MRDWLKKLDQIDRDCVYHYEFLLGRKLNDYAEYKEIDGQVNDYALEYKTKAEFFKEYPHLKSYAKNSGKNSVEPVNNEAVNPKRERFIRIAEQRTQKVLDDLTALSKCAAKESYEYSDADVDKILSAVESGVKSMREKFQGVKHFSLSTSSKDKVSFSAPGNVFSHNNSDIELFHKLMDFKKAHGLTALSIPTVMSDLYNEINVPPEELYILANQLVNGIYLTDGPFLYGERITAIQTISENGFEDILSRNCNLGPDASYEFLLNCSAKDFIAVVDAAAKENQACYTAEWEEIEASLDLIPDSSFSVNEAQENKPSLDARIINAASRTVDNTQDNSPVISSKNFNSER